MYKIHKSGNFDIDNSRYWEYNETTVARSSPLYHNLWTFAIDIEEKEKENGYRR